MAKNYSFGEACRIITAGTDFEAIADIGRRYPILLQKVATVAAKAGADFVDLMSFMPDYLTANKINSVIKSAIADGDEADDANETAEAVHDADDETEASDEVASTDYESMSAKEMWELLGKAGKRKLAKSTKKADLIEACKKAFGEGAAEDTDDVEDEADTDTAENPYEGKSAMELFKMCKKRGIKAAAKKPAKFYADLLVKADASADETTEEADGWDDDEATAEKPAKADKKHVKSDKQPTTNKANAADDEDDDWDI